MHKETITVTVDVPDGYELTGELRPPKAGEISLMWGNPISFYKWNEDASAPCFILRKAWIPPAWMPEGYWLYKAADGWYISKTEPEKIGDHFAVSGKDGGSLCKLTHTGAHAVNSLSILKIQIKHAKT